MPRTTRPVKVFERKYVSSDGWQTVILSERAIFHGFGADVEEDETGFSSYSTAIVELPDGSVIMPRADRIQFLEPVPNAKRDMAIAEAVVAACEMSASAWARNISPFATDSTIFKFNFENLPEIIARVKE